MMTNGSLKIRFGFLVGLIIGGKDWVVKLVSDAPYIKQLVVEYGDISPYIVGMIFTFYTIIAVVLIRPLTPHNPLLN